MKNIKILTMIFIIGLLFVGQNYKQYLKYKNSLIERYGLKIYNLMNREINVNTELESFIYYIKNGI